MNATQEHIDIPADLDSLTVAGLREIVDAVGLDVPSKAPKATLVEAVEEYRRLIEERVAASLAAAEPEEVEAEAETVADEEIESTALALREEPVVQAPALLPSEAEFDAMLAIAGRIASTQMVPTAYRGKPDDVLAAILTGRELGLGPMHSLRAIYVVDGKPSLSADLLLARMREGGLVIEDSESTAERAWIRARRRDTGERAEVEWTIEEARSATYRVKGGGTKPLASKDNWVNYPADMLWARAVGRLARRLGSDLIGAAMPYSSEEVQDWDDEAPADPGGDAPRGYGSDRQAGTWIAPKDWRELSARLSGDHVLGEDAGVWMEELAEKAYRMPSLGDVVKSDEIEDDRKRDLWKRLLVVLRSLEDAGAPNGIALLPDPRRTIQETIYEAFDKTIALTGPSWALNGEEAEAGMPQRAEVAGGDLPAGNAAATETSSETPEDASGAEDAAEEPLVDQAGDEIKF